MVRLIGEATSEATFDGMVTASTARMEKMGAVERQDLIDWAYQYDDYQIVSLFREATGMDSDEGFTSTLEQEACMKISRLLGLEYA